MKTLKQTKVILVKNKKLMASISFNVVLGVIACVLFLGWEQSRQSLRQAELKVGYDQLEHQLCVPAEALYRDTLNPEHNRIFRQICELRKGYFPDEFLPYQAVVRPGSATIHHLEDPSSIVNGSFETFWINEANRGLGQLASEVERGSELGAYIREQAQKENAHIVLLAKRLLASPNSHHRIRAAHLLLALGHRDAKVLEVVRAFAEEKKTPARSDQGMVMIHSWEHDRAVKLTHQYLRRDKKDE